MIFPRQTWRHKKGADQVDPNDLFERGDWKMPYLTALPVSTGGLYGVFGTGTINDYPFNAMRCSGHCKSLIDTGFFGYIGFAEYVSKLFCQCGAALLNQIKQGDPDALGRGRRCGCLT